MPLAIDQFFWGERIHRLGVAPRPIPQRSLTARKLTQALQTVLQDVTMQAQAQKLAASLSRENGAQAAANVIRSILPHRQG
jgi:sterol 3beta-glucosyltransferase